VSPSSQRKARRGWISIHAAFKEQGQRHPLAEEEVDGGFLLAPDGQDPFPAGVEVGIVHDGVALDGGPGEAIDVTAFGSLMESETFGLALMCSSFRENRTLDVR
jgi:hypothetical protein